MAASKPDIPKKFAARIRGAQARVQDARDTIVHCHKSRLQAQSELDVFHRDPAAYAADRYGNHGIDSYPVQTRTARLAENVAYRTKRIAEFEEELPKAEKHLKEVEASVLEQVLAMRPGAGRVPWPEPLPSFQGSIERGLVSQQRDIDAEPARVAAHRARIKMQFDREMAQSKQQDQREADAERERFANLTPAQQESERAQSRMFRQILEERGLTVADLFDGLGVSDHFLSIDAEMRTRQS